MSVSKNIILNVLTTLFIACEAQALRYEKFSNGYFTYIHVLTVDPNEHDIRPVKAKGGSVERETVLTLAKHHGALAAVNGGFWRANGQPAGVLKINNLWYERPSKSRGAVGWSLDHKKAIIDRVTIKINSRPNNNDLVRDTLVIPTYTAAQEWKELEHIVGGAPLLVISGNVLTNYTPEKTTQSFLLRKHPRTAVGIKETGEWVFVVVDGYFFNFFGGMEIVKLAHLMRFLGCIAALNLDGGGSSTMILDGSVVNTPCGRSRENGKWVESVSDAILIFPKNGSPV